MTDRTFFLRTIAFGLALLFAPVAGAEAPSRIVSINLCTDGLLLALADPAQIAALSTYATDPTLSFFADEAPAFRHDADRAETVIELKPDLVIGGPFSRRATRDLLRRLGYRVVDVAPALSIAETIAQIGEVARLVGHPERGEALIAEIEAARDRAAAMAKDRGTPPSAAFYQRRGYVNGGDTLTGELMGIAGFRDVGQDLAGKNGSFVPLERLVAERPDLLVVASTVPRAEDQGSALLAHPALVELYPPSRRIVLPERFTVCGGPSVASALDWLAAEAQRAAGVSR